MLETVASLLWDALSSLWLPAATAAYFAATQFDYGESGVLNSLSFSGRCLRMRYRIKRVTPPKFTRPVGMLISNRFGPESPDVRSPLIRRDYILGRSPPGQTSRRCGMTPQ